MAIVKPFKAYRPKNEIAKDVASRPYDVLNSDEARIEATGNPFSFLHITKSEIDLPAGTDIHSEIVYQKAKENLQKMITGGLLIQDTKPCYYIYAQTMWKKTQYGIVGCASVEDYLQNKIKKHELTRPDKEEDRKNHIRTTNFNAEPVFLVYPDNKKLELIIRQYISKPAEYNFMLNDGIGHQLWVIDNFEDVNNIEKIFRENIPYTYVADGHHRTAAAAHVGEERKNKNHFHNGNEEYNFFMAVYFPASQLTIIDYNRLVKDLNGLNKVEFLTKLEHDFTVEKKGHELYKPKFLHNFSMYLDSEWYSLTANSNTYDDNNPIDCLDVTLLSKFILSTVLNITDLRKSTRIDFVGGIRGLDELKRRVDSDEMAAAFALYPVSMKQLIDVADSGNIMPPKTTWFEPKLRSGLFIHDLE